MHDVMTPAEKTLARGTRSDAIVQMRHLYQEAMQADYTEAVERLSGKKVVAFISGNHLRPDIAAEVFVLDGDLEAR
jgi:uncharacterized protein YbcI